MSEERRPVAMYVHRIYNGRIIVYSDGSMEARNASGKKKKKTSATPEKLARGHGEWVRVQGWPE